MRSHTLTNVLIGLLSAFLLFLGIRGFVAPESAAIGFGFPLAHPADAFFLRVKADRDLSIGIALAAMLVLRQRRALVSVLAPSLVMPIVDCTLVLAGGRATVLYALLVHGGAVVYCAVLLALLLRENEREGARHAQARGAVAS